MFLKIFQDLVFQSFIVCWVSDVDVKDGVEIKKKQMIAPKMTNNC